MGHSTLTIVGEAPGVGAIYTGGLQVHKDEKKNGGEKQTDNNKKK